MQQLNSQAGKSIGIALLLAAALLVALFGMGVFSPSGAVPDVDIVNIQSRESGESLRNPT